MTALTSVGVEGVKRDGQGLHDAISDGREAGKNGAGNLVSRGAMQLGFLNVKGKAALQPCGCKDANIEEAVGFVVER